MTATHPLAAAVLQQEAGEPVALLTVAREDDPTWRGMNFIGLTEHGKALPAGKYELYATPQVSPPQARVPLTELPAVAWTRPRFPGAFISNAEKVEAGDGEWERDYTISLTPHAPAQAVIKELTNQRNSWQAMAHRYGNENIAMRSELAALKAKQVAEVDEVMRLADEYAAWKAAHEEHATSGSLSHMNAAREALHAFLTKDRT